MAYTKCPTCGMPGKLEEKMRKGPNPVVKTGRSDYHNSKERDENPWPAGSDNRKAWDRGWMAARREACR